MNQSVTITRIGGRAAVTVAEMFARWQGQRVPDLDDPSLVDPSQWPATTLDEIDEFLRRLRDHANDPPVLYCSWHVDSWSMGDVFERPFQVVGRPAFEVCLSNGAAYGYALPDEGALERRLTSLGRDKGRAAECRWYEQSLKQALEAGASFSEPSFLIVERRVGGGLITDDELADSLLTVPDWLQPLRKAEEPLK